MVPLFMANLMGFAQIKPFLNGGKQMSGDETGAARRTTHGDTFPNCFWGIILIPA